MLTIKISVTNGELQPFILFITREMLAWKKSLHCLSWSHARAAWATGSNYHRFDFYILTRISWNMSDAGSSTILLQSNGSLAKWSTLLISVDI